MPNRRDGTGTTFGGTGEPMDVQYNKMRSLGQCFNCQQTGHVARNCPKKTQTIRNMIMDLPPDDRRSLADDIASLKESDLDKPADEQQHFQEPEA